MRRKVPVPVLVSVAVSLLLLGWLSHPFLRRGWSSTLPGGNFESSYLFKGASAEDKAVVIAKMAAENTSWVTDELHDWQHAIYHMDDPNWILHPPVNKGRESMAYLTFVCDKLPWSRTNIHLMLPQIISHYAVLPEVVVFLHPHRNGWPQAWHTDAADYDNVNSIRGLRLDYVRENGYANMRCIEVPGCPDEVQPFRNDVEREYEIAFADAYTYMFGGNHSTVPHTFATPCCAQFAVSAERVRKRPLEDYVRYRQWLIDTTLENYDSGRVMEYLWHVIFGKDPVWCPELHQCWCDQFGRC